MALDVARWGKVTGNGGGAAHAHTDTTHLAILHPLPLQPLMAAGRAAALDLLVRVRGDGHGWECARPRLCVQLRRPLTVVLLKCAGAAPGDAAAVLGPRLLATAVSRPRLRAVLKVGDDGGWWAGLAGQGWA